MTARYVEGDNTGALWLTDAGWEVRTANETQTLGHVDASDALAALDSVQRRVRESRKWWLAA